MALRLKANRRFPSVPVVTDDPKNHTQVLMAIKEAMEIGQRRTTDLLNSYIRVQDLVDLGLITIEGNTNSIVSADLSQIASIGDLTGAAEGDFLRFEGGQWINDQLALTDITQAMVTQHQAALSISWAQLTGAPPSLNDLFDVDAPAPTDGDVLTWNDASSEWIAAAPTGGGGGSQYLDDLLDVDAPYPVAGDVLTWDGYSWVNQAPEGGGGGGSVYPPDEPPVSPSAYDDEFNAGSLDGKWAWRNQNGSTATFPDDTAILLEKPSSASDDISQIEQSITAGTTFKIRAKLFVQPKTAAQGNYFVGGLVVYNTANTRAYMWGPGYVNNNVIYVDMRSGTGSFIGNVGSVVMQAFPGSWVYLEIERDATTLYFRMSANGYFYRTLFTQSLATWIGDVDRFGLFLFSANSGPVPVMMVDWFRRVA